MNYFKPLFFANVLLLVFSLVYSFYPSENLFWNGYGILLILTFAGNIAASTIGTRYKKLGIVYLLLSNLGFFLIALLNTGASMAVTNEASRSFISTTLLCVLLVIGAVTTSTYLVHKKRPGRFSDNWDLVPEKTITKVMRIGSLVLLGLFLLMGIGMKFVLLTKISVGIVEVVVSQYALFYSLIFLSVAGLIVKLTRFMRSSLFSRMVSAIGIGLFLIFLLPFLSVPFLLHGAEENYTEAFGEEWQTYTENVPAFKDVPFSVPSYFFWHPVKRLHCYRRCSLLGGDRRSRPRIRIEV